MRALLQRVCNASVTVAGSTVAEIGPGLLVLVGIKQGDGEAQAEQLAAKILKLRIFPDETGKMNEPLGWREILCVSQFTLYGDTQRGNRPSFGAAAPSCVAEPLYLHFCNLLNAKQGVFGADMSVSLTNEGPVTLLLES